MKPYLLRRIFLLVLLISLVLFVCEALFSDAPSDGTLSPDAQSDAATLPVLKLDSFPDFVSDAEPSSGKDADLLSKPDIPSKTQKERLESLGMTQNEQKGKDGGTLLYCEGKYGFEQPGAPAILLFLHGGGARGDDNFAQLGAGVGDFVRYVRKNKIKAVILAPQCPRDGQWVNTPANLPEWKIPDNPSESMGRVIALLHEKITEHAADRKRVYVTGYSMGGFGTWDIVCRFPDLFAAAIPICGGADLNQASKLKNLPLLIFHGEKDAVVPPVFSRYMFAMLKRVGNHRAVYFEIPGMKHNVWDRVYAEERTPKWLFEQTRETAP